MSSKNAAAPSTDSLEQALWSTLDESGADEQCRFAALVQVLVRQGQAMGFSETRLLRGGALDEIVVAARLNMTASSAIHGHDALDRDGGSVEIKTSRLTDKHRCN